MNSTRFSAALISLVGLAGLAAGCDGNDETNPTDTRVDTGSPDTGGGDHGIRGPVAFRIRP